MLIIAFKGLKIEQEIGRVWVTRWITDGWHMRHGMGYRLVIDESQISHIWVRCVINKSHIVHRFAYKWVVDKSHMGHSFLHMGHSLTYGSLIDIWITHSYIWVTHWHMGHPLTYASLILTYGSLVVTNGSRMNHGMYYRWMVQMISGREKIYGRWRCALATDNTSIVMVSTLLDDSDAN